MKISNKIEKKCKKCNKKFFVPTYRQKQWPVQYCSLKCRNAQIEKRCKICKKIFLVSSCYIKNGGGKYCSRNCYYKSRLGKDNPMFGVKRNGKDNPNWKGGRIAMLKRRSNDIHYRLRYVISSSINHKLKKRLSSKKGKSTFNFLPYTIDDLIKHLERLFTKGMTWDNQGVYGWHIDHIKPDSLFNYKSVDDKEFQECWALKNLQPMWAKII